MIDNKKRVLLVDDDENIRTMYAEIFANAGFSVEEASDGADGFAKATRNVPDIIFTGIDMPRMDGFSLIEALRKDPALANIPIIMSSHRGRKEDEARAKEMGVKDFVIFGMITPKQVVEKIKSIFKEKTYIIKFDKIELDAQKLSSDLGAENKDFKCAKCGEDLVLSLETTDLNNLEFKAKFICPSCK